MNQLQGRLKDIDCIVEVHDARVDLADLRHMRFLEDELKQNSPSLQKILYTNCKEQTNHVLKKKLMPAVLELLMKSPRYHREYAAEYNLLVIGIPNVGKSSFINSLRRTHLKKGGKATLVGAKAGITRSVLEKIKVSESPKVYVFDSPGILQPKITDMEVGMKLALCGCLQDHMVGEDIIADYLLFWLNKHKHFKYVKHFNLDEPTDDIQELLYHLSKQRKMALKHRSSAGGYVYKPNYLAAAQIMIRSFRNGELGKINLDQDKLKKQITQENSLQPCEQVT